VISILCAFGACPSTLRFLSRTIVFGRRFLITKRQAWWGTVDCAELLRSANLRSVWLQQCGPVWSSSGQALIWRGLASGCQHQRRGAVLYCRRRGCRNWLPAPGRDQITWSKELNLGDLRQQNPALPLTLSGLRSIALPSCVLESLQGDAWPFERSRQKGSAGDVAHGILKTKPPGRIAARDRGRQNPCR